MINKELFSNVLLDTINSRGNSIISEFNGTKCRVCKNYYVKDKELLF